jgi:UPF0716 protein FxsA
MRRFPWGLVAIALPLAEIAAFVVVGRWIGVWWVLALVIGAGLLGGAILRGRMSVLRSTVRGRGGIAALGAVADEALLAVGAVLLMVPGFLSDLAALPLLLPPVRRVLVAALAAKVVVARPPRGWDDDVIEGEVIDVDAVRGRRPDGDDGPLPPSAWTRH